MAAEILNARPYTFLDDAPLEERRTQAVLNRRWSDPQNTDDPSCAGRAGHRRRPRAWMKCMGVDEPGVHRQPEVTRHRGRSGCITLARVARAQHVARTVFVVAVERLSCVQTVIPTAHRCCRVR